MAIAEQLLAVWETKVAGKLMGSVSAKKVCSASFAKRVVVKAAKKGAANKAQANVTAGKAACGSEGHASPAAWAAGAMDAATRSLEIAPRVANQILQVYINKYGSAQELRSTFGHLKSFKISESWF